jgi:Spy/CpxP family protein refolding chaperone
MQKYKHMKNILRYLGCLLLLVSIQTYGQNNAVESARVAFISQKVELTPAQAEKFWPLYNELNNQRTDIKKTIRQIYDKMTLASEQTTEKAKGNIEQLSLLKQKEASLEKDYYNRFLIIISPKQLADLFAAEREFQKILLKKVATD